MPALIWAVLLALQPALSRAFTVCVVRDPPWTICNVNDTSRDSFSGYDVEMFRFVANSSRVHWREAANSTAGYAGTIASGNWAFKCVTNDWDTIMNGLADKSNGNDPNTAPCAVAIGDIIPKSQRYEAGVLFSAPYYHTGLAIMIAPPPPPPFNKWGFLKPFNWSLWLALGLTLLVMPSVVWFVETMNLYGHIPLTKPSLYEMKAATYETIMACFNIAIFEVTTLPAQLVIVCFLFLNMIMISSYTANLASVFTNAGGEVVTITSWKDLRNLPIGAPKTYTDGLHTRYGFNRMVQGDTYDGSNLDQLIAGKAALLNGSIAAYVTNSESIRKFMGPAQYNVDCTLAMIPFDVLEPAFSFAIAFHNNFPDDLVGSNVSSAVMTAEESGLLYNLHEKYLHYDDSCIAPTVSEVGIAFYQLSGLWILLAGALGIALLWTLVRIVMLARRHLRDISEERALPQLGLDMNALSTETKKQMVGEAISRVFVKDSSTMSRSGSADESFNGKLPHTESRRPSAANYGNNSSHGRNAAASNRFYRGSADSMVTGAAAPPPPPIIPVFPSQMPPSLPSMRGSSSAARSAMTDDLPSMHEEDELDAGADGLYGEGPAPAVHIGMRA